MKNPTEMLKEIKNLLGIELSEEVKEQEVTTEQVEASSEEVTLAQMTLENGTVLEAEAFEAGNEVFIVTEDEKVAVPVGEYTMEDGMILVVAEEGIIGEIKEAEAEEEEVEAAEEEMAYATKEELAEVKSMIEEIKAMIEKKEDMAKEEEEAQLKEELSKPAAAPLKHNPETENKKPQVLFSQRRASSTRDRVFQKIANLK
jgi:hypothetical protein